MKTTVTTILAITGNKQKMVLAEINGKAIWWGNAEDLPSQYENRVVADLRSHNDETQLYLEEVK